MSNSAEPNSTTEREGVSLRPQGQDEAWEKLLLMRLSLPQCLTLLGPEGVGKRRAVRALFQLLHCESQVQVSAMDTDSLFKVENPSPSPPATPEELREACGLCGPCRKIASGNHPDVILVSPDGNMISVDSLREMQRLLYFSPIEGRYRFIVIDQAHRMTSAAANTLLKTLEEPPPHTRFFLLTQERGSLLSTILSRSQFLHFSPLSDRTILELSEQLGLKIPDDIRSIVLGLSYGGLGRLGFLTEEKTTAFLREADAWLSKHVTGMSPRWEEACRYAEQLGSAGEAYLELFLDLFLWKSSQRLLAQLKLSGKTGVTDSVSTFSRASEALALRGALERNLNRKLASLCAAELSSRDHRGEP